jgi:oligopeptide/dipeptide ABC transporter ATP-binding protein
MADEIMVMYLGKIVESAPVDDIFFDPRHPYTRGLLRSIPSVLGSRKERLVPIRGVVPASSESIPGCVFEPRCPEAKDQCRREMPTLLPVSGRHRVACWCSAA